MIHIVEYNYIKYMYILILSVYSNKIILKKTRLDKKNFTDKITICRYTFSYIVSNYCVIKLDSHYTL